jgi:hypothetical protein
MSGSEKVDLCALFHDLQQELEGRLGTARRNLAHPGAKGSVTESEWTALLAAYLPRRYVVSKGFVVDVEGCISNEIDIIVHDRHFSPLLFHHAETCYVPAESVYGIFEVKQELNPENIRYAGQKAASVRVLSRTSTAIPHAGGRFTPREAPEILGGILTSASTWTEPRQRLEETLSLLPPSARLQMGCCARGLAFHATYGESTVVDVSKPEESLVFFVLHLLRELQSVGSVPAIDYGAYLKVLDHNC